MRSPPWVSRTVLDGGAYQAGSGKLAVPLSMLTAAGAFPDGFHEVRNMVSVTPIHALHRNSFHFKPLSFAKRAATTDCGDRGIERKSGSQFRFRSLPEASQFGAIRLLTRSFSNPVRPCASRLEKTAKRQTQAGAVSFAL